MEIEKLTQYLYSKKYKLKINEIICIIEKFSKANDGIFDDIKISAQKNHSVYIFTDMKHLDNRFSGINTHNAGNSGGVFPAAVNQLIRFLNKAYELRTKTRI
jgi:hypothetical protein